MAEESHESLENPLLAEIFARYETARDNAASWRSEAREDFRFYAGNQWSDDDIEALKRQGRPVVTFNRIKRLIDAVKGHETNNRAKVKYLPRTMGDVKVNELFTNAGNYFKESCDAEHEEGDAFGDAATCGMGWTQDRLSDNENPDYDLIEERVDPLEMLWDSSSKKPNLADARYLFRRKRYTEKEIKTIWPDFDGPFVDAFDDDLDSGLEPHDATPRNSYKGEGGTKDVKPDVLVLEYQYKEREAYYVVEDPDPESGQTTTFELPIEDENDALVEKLKAKKVNMVLKRRSVVRRCFVIGRTIVQGPDVVYKDGFTYHCITGFRDQQKNHWFGIVRMLKDPQRWSNKWLAQMMHIFNSNAKGGVMAEEDAVLDKNNFEQSWADQSMVTYVASGALKDARIQPKPPPTYPTGVDKLLQYANESFTDVSGVNQELLGLADREQPGVLEWQRKQSAVTLLAPLFDSLRRFRKMQGRCWLAMMQKYMSDGRLIRITQDQPDGSQREMAIPFGGPQEQQMMLPPEWRMPETAEFDVIVDQASSAPNQKEATWAVITQLAGVAKEMFMNPPVMLWALKYSPLPDSALEELRQIAQQEASKPPPPDPAMMKAQADIQAKQAELQLKQQEAQLNMAVEQQKAQMQLEIEKQKMALELQKAEMQMGIERQKAQHSMQLQQEQFQFDTVRQQQQAALDEQAQQHDMAREDMAFERQSMRDDEASAAKIKREDRSARAKAKRSQQQPGAE